MVARVPFGSLFNFASKSGSVSNLADRKSTRLNSSHDQISYAVFCLKSKEHTSELQSRSDLVCRLLLDKQRGGLAIPSSDLIVRSPVCTTHNTLSRMPSSARKHERAT